MDTFYKFATFTFTIFLHNIFIYEVLGFEPMTNNVDTLRLLYFSDFTGTGYTHLPLGMLIVYENDR